MIQRLSKANLNSQQIGAGNLLYFRFNERWSGYGWKSGIYLIHRYLTCWNPVHGKYIFSVHFSSPILPPTAYYLSTMDFENILNFNSSFEEKPNQIFLINSEERI
jgi:hypothetical protein